MTKITFQKRVFVFDGILHPVWWEKIKSKTKTRFCFSFLSNSVGIFSGAFHILVLIEVKCTGIIVRALQQCEKTCKLMPIYKIICDDKMSTDQDPPVGSTFWGTLSIAEFK